MIAVVFAMMPGTAAAHHPEVIGVQLSCYDEDWARVDYTVGAWAGYGTDPTNDPSRANPSIEVRAAVEGGSFSVIGNGAFTAPDYQFSGTVLAPSGANFRLRVKATAQWGNGRGAGQARTAFFSAPDCAPSPHQTQRRRPLPR